MLIHDIIKIKYVKLGHIKKNYPYHLISDEEMFSAFIDLGEGYDSSLVDPKARFFDIYYPDPFTDDDYYIKKWISPDGVVHETRVMMKPIYSTLKASIQNNILTYLKSQGTPNETALPDWVYTYMLGEVVYNKSEYLDIEDTLELLGCDNLENAFTTEACIACYKTSLNYISSLVTRVNRPPTVFGEPHVIKSLRMES